MIAAQIRKTTAHASNSDALRMAALDFRMVNSLLNRHRYLIYAARNTRREQFGETRSVPRVLARRTAPYSHGGHNEEGGDV